MAPELAIDTEKRPSSSHELEDSPDNESEIQVSPDEERRIVHKIDRRLILATGFMFAVSLMDRVNLGYAANAGMAKELKLTVGNRYVSPPPPSSFIPRFLGSTTYRACINTIAERQSTVAIAFFPTYVVFEWPGALLAKKIGPRYFLPASVLLWGVVMLCAGFVQTWGQLVAIRAIIGTLEAGLFPGSLFLLQSWYRRYDVHKRYATFYLISLVGGSLSGVLASGFMQMQGVGGYLGWRYIFIWEGVLTILVGFLGAYLIVDFPNKAKNSRSFLSPRELQIVVQMLEKDRGEVDNDKFNLREYLSAALDWKVWAMGMMFLSSTVVSYSISFFLPLILRNKMGYSILAANALSTPPYIFTAFYMYAQGWVADRYRFRAPHLVWNSLQSICGLCLLAWTKSAGSQYFGVFLVTAGCNASIPTVMAYQSNNIRGTWRRAFCSASLITMGGTGGIVGALVFRAKDAPQYLPGIYASIGFCILTIVLVAVLDLHFFRMNKKAERDGTPLQGLVGFRYTL
ncbi:hypothetical protein H2204_003141 [Knufia peltigerae]|uniref:Major facilitator superfamily (MFS) profile domain-containing protein n=1 Tax=Knufia peltigerae TaxID=1002370 RepID=A0AA39D0P2_9EURO|nr:hypothetical protein H2204_003141 [Knufia peltigerae]